jgi:hypothetical protein
MRRASLLLALAAAPAFGQYLQPTGPAIDPLREVRICGAPKRDAKGEIVRSSAVLAAFRRIYPCPSTGLHTGACPGWQINHSVPLARGGCDSVSNLTYVPVQIKTCRADWCIDRWERRYYGVPFGVMAPFTGE